MHCSGKVDTNHELKHSYSTNLERLSKSCSTRRRNLPRTNQNVRCEVRTLSDTSLRPSWHQEGWASSKAAIGNEDRPVPPKRTQASGLATEEPLTFGLVWTPSDRLTWDGPSLVASICGGRGDGLVHMALGLSGSWGHWASWQILALDRILLSTNALKV